MDGGLGKRFRRLWLAAGLSNVADGAALVAATVVANRLSATATPVALLAVAYMLPQAAVALPAGAIADRVDRRRLMLGLNAARAAAVGLVVVAALTGWLGLPVLYAAALCLGAAEAAVDATAQSTVPMITDRDRLQAANSRLFGTQLAGNEFIGGPLAGLLVVVAVAWAFAVPAGLYALAAVALVTLPGTYRVARPAAGRLRVDVAEGLRALLAHRLLRTLALMAGVANFGLAAASAVLVVFVVGPDAPLGLAEPAYPMLLAVLAAGAVSAALAGARIERLLGTVRLLVVVVVVFVAAQLSLAVLAAPAAVALALFLIGAAAMLANITLASLRQRLTPSALMGRVTAATRTIAVAAAPLGGALAGPVADALGVQAVFAVAAGVVALALFGFRAVTPAALAAAEARALDADEARAPA
jgi:predicted MFS family arabinose efflux permease